MKRSSLWYLPGVLCALLQKEMDLQNEGKETRQDQRIDDKKAQESIRL